MKYHVEFQDLFLLEAVEADLCYFFENWLTKLKYPHLRISEPPSNNILLAYFSLSESIHKISFNMRYPVVGLNGIVFSEILDSFSSIVVLDCTSFSHQIIIHLQELMAKIQFLGHFKLLKMKGRRSLVLLHGFIHMSGEQNVVFLPLTTTLSMHTAKCIMQYQVQ